jgi:hypothetical protein
MEEIKGRPIKPNEITENLDKIIPPYIFDVVNQLLMERYRGGSAKFKLKELKALLKDKGHNTDEAVKKGHLDFEGAYRNMGWKVVYDSPGFRENYDANFTFKKK